MPDWEADHESEHDVGVVTESQQHVKKPPLYKVLLHNDDFTTMEFVVDILRNVFHKSESDAVHIMLAVHEQGVGVAGVYTRNARERVFRRRGFWLAVGRAPEGPGPRVHRSG